MPTVIIAGAGLVGSLNAVFFARRGWDVQVYDQREDIRKMEHVPGRSINLALSCRGKEALEAVGLKDYIADRGVQMHARLVHSKDGKGFVRQPYGQPGEHIVSINRRHLNEVMISEAEKYDNVEFFFEHKVQKVDMRNKRLIASHKGQEVVVSGDIVLACDGAYSAVRRSLMTYPRFDYSQEYIEHGYVELNILPKNDQFAMEPNVFHLWPRGDFTLIALANTDCTFTVTLFAPFDLFDKELFDMENRRIQFFRDNFPDALELMGEEHVNETFNRVKQASSLVSIKCRPFTFNDFVVLMGDAAHAMVPFYGQGMNCGFEDCLILHEIVNEYNGDLVRAVRTYSDRRWKDAHTINDLAMYNYNELKDLVNQFGYKLRKKLDLSLNKYLGPTWIPLYSMILKWIRYGIATNVLVAGAAYIIKKKSEYQ
ncbi:unnamed protein product [Bursaphelenchus okinawaensis]|uniref:FAD-binding domain-containing protein n=1 Tax=Bursaphelenchus okinawaensis TaxID=465554 RepID=A0A811L364_9BILA|nr:unnamed protein product [Bursaphelenchus okinawaensis]CAG9116601.1 unnamed protein product [Bursaphelenchus okinawaensis]